MSDLGVRFWYSFVKDREKKSESKAGKTQVNHDLIKI